REHNKQVLRFGMVVMNKGRVQNHFKHFYLIDEKLNNLNFQLKKNKDLKLIDKNKSIIVDEIHKKYDSLKLFLKKTKDKDTLHRVYFYFKEKYEKENKVILAELNKVFYISLLPNRNDNKVKHYIENIDKPIVSNALNDLLYSYIRRNFLKIDFSILNNNKDKEFLRYLSISMFNFLKNEGNIGDNRYIEAIKWLKTTDFYKENRGSIDKKLTPIDSEVFKKKIKKLKILDIKLKTNTFSEIIYSISSKYFLIDFWATWCAPCIGGVKIMNKMDFPKNIEVISISLDKEKDIEKWKQKTKELKQQYTYWLDEKSNEGKSFLQFIELQSIPRYILIDRNLNLIDQAFYHPNEMQFLAKLKDIKNHKYW
uniref:TlpA family protein disulfide reductase n=1 Tax=Polaribacter sp. TaxID=1920175 RepID=UPI003F6AE6CE